MEGVSAVHGKRKKTRPPRGAARRSIHSHVHSHRWRSEAKRFSYTLRRVFRRDWSPAKWASAEAPCPSG